MLTVLSALAVVILHTNGVFWAFSYDRYWLTANVIESLFYFAVPVFFMISGATLMDYRKRYSTKDFLKKRFLRAMFPWLVWSCIGAVWVYATSATLPDDFKEIISGILNNRYIDIFWFFSSLFAVYLAIPILSLVPAEKRKAGFGYAIAMAVLTISFLPLLCSLLGVQWNSALQVPAVGGYLMYVLIGHWVSQYEMPRKGRIALYVAGVVGLLVHIGGTWVLSYDAGEIVPTFKGYLNLPCVLYSTAIFVAFRNLENTAFMEKASSWAGRISGLCLGAYLLQFFFLSSVKLYTDINALSIWYRLFGGVAIFVMCLVITWVLKKVPVVRKIMG